MNMFVLENEINGCLKNENTVILHINHCMDNSFYFNKQLLKVFNQVVFIAVPYNNRGVDENAEYPCYHASKIDSIYLIKKNNKVIGTTDSDFLNATYELIRRAFKTELLEFAEKGKKIIIIEDGGYHHDIINELINEYPALKGAVLGAVEQTTEGTNRSYKNNLYPILSGARSLYKMRIESYFIANTVVNEFSRILQTINEFIDFHHIYILGYGVIGRSIAKNISAYNTTIHVYDTDDEVAGAARDDGFIVETGSFAFENNSAVIGCSGTASFTKEMLNSFINGGAARLFLVSASSKQVEFSDIFDVLDSCGKQRHEYCTEYSFSNGKEIFLIADGYPVNFFDVSKDSLAYSMIDIVFAELLLLAVCLNENHEKLDNKISALSDDEFVDAFVNEKRLLSLWRETHNFALDVNRFNIHPYEDKLKLRFNHSI